MSAIDTCVQAKNRLARISTLAESLMPAFRDKFDFSDPKNFDALAEICFTAAEAMFRNQEARLATIDASYQVDLAAETQRNAALESERAKLANKEAANG